MVRVLLIGNLDLPRHSLGIALQAEPGIEIIGETTQDLDAVTKALALRPDVVLMDSLASNGSRVPILRLIAEQSPETKVLVLSPDFDLDLFREAIEAGALGYELMNVSSLHLADAIRTICAGRVAISPAVMRLLSQSLKAAEPAPAHPPARVRYSQLTPRELQIVSRVALGQTDKEIAVQLFVSEATVKSHLRSIYSKLNIRKRVQLATFATSRDLIPLVPS
jgi:DNA-binding NarL/FixJ family response regulator